MPSFNPFTPVSGRYTLFEIRLENDFIVFRGNEHEAAGQLLKGTVVLCLSAPLRLENIHLKLTGTVHYTWTDAKVTATGISTHKVDKALQILEHRWPPFVGIGAPDPAGDGSRQQTKGTTLPPGNYEWPFELLLGGDTTESVEGMREASIMYKLKATIARGKLLHDIHAYKQLRVIRTLDASALEFLHAMSIENIWPNKIEYSIVVPQKAIVFGSSIPVEMRFTPLLKGLELGDITIKLLEVHDIILTSQTGHSIREHKKEREIDMWTLSVSREEHWRDIIDGDNGPEGWVVDTSLDLPKKLSQCLQDVNTQGIKIRHKLKIVVALNNPDGHVSELRATLPVTIFISPNMPLDEEGNLVRLLPNGASREAATMAPPSYNDHRLDQLYEDIDLINLHSPIGGRSGVSSPLLGHSRAGSTDNLPALVQGASVHPDLLAHRLHSMSLEERHRNASWNSNLSAAGTLPRTGTSNAAHAGDETRISPPPSAPLTRQNSGDGPSGSSTPPEHVDFPQISELSRVPSYQTAVKTPVRPLATDMFDLPDYETALT
ncbi:b2534ac8-1a7b-4ce0-8310-2f9d7f667695 [Thermothielavioides terrestris]|uniref:B2534ac8-1a7b-4ce0-8310-2f9d7f667695 n=1 Tax=Thermothielavioides terrestris TaxID=2587410 RepID=A0A3S4AQ51_9PEZI|nr:b2534ac8-1a7b-4ce0-8310-2f9d7f667695 [Thermothielavioides terrestris]